MLQPAATTEKKLQGRADQSTVLEVLERPAVDAFQSPPPGSSRSPSRSGAPASSPRSSTTSTRPPVSPALNTVGAAALVILPAAYLLGLALVYLHVTPGATRRLAALASVVASASLTAFMFLSLSSASCGCSQPQLPSSRARVEAQPSRSGMARMGQTWPARCEWLETFSSSAPPPTWRPWPSCSGAPTCSWPPHRSTRDWGLRRFVWRRGGMSQVGAGRAGARPSHGVQGGGAALGGEIGIGLPERPRFLGTKLTSNFYGPT